MSSGGNVKSGWLDRSTKYTRSWGKRYVTLERSSRRLLYAENDQKPAKGILLMKKIIRTAEKNETLKLGNPDLYSFAVEGNDLEGKEMTWLMRASDSSAFDDWYSEIRTSIAAHGLMEPVHFGLPDRDPRCDLPLITVPVHHLFRFSLLDKAIMYFFGVCQLVKPPQGPDGQMQLHDHILVLCDKNNYLFNYAADVIRCFPVSALEVIRAGDGCVGLKLQHPQHDVMFKTEQPVAIIDILRRTFNVATGQDVDVESSDSKVDEMIPDLHLRPFDGFQLTVSAPTPKQKLKHALDVYERQTGQAFVYGSAQNPAAPQTKTSHHTADQMDVEDPMCALLMKCKLNQYIVLMQRQHLDLDVLRCMEESDLVSFGITDADHRHIIIEAVRGNFDEALIEANADAGDMTNDSFGGSGSGSQDSPTAVVAPKRPVMIVLDSDDDDDMNLILPSQKPAVVLDDDEDDLVLPKKSAVVLDDSDEDLVVGNNKASASAAAATIGDDI